jgi:hypothetical protein
VVEGLKEAAAGGGGGPAADPNAEAWLQRAFGELAAPQEPGFASGAPCIFEFTCMSLHACMSLIHGVSQLSRYGNRWRPKAA